MGSQARRPREDSPIERVRDAAHRIGATVESATAGRCYVTAPAGMAWAVDPELHVLMIALCHPEDVAMGLGWIGRGLVDCSAPGCRSCAPPVAPVAARERDLRIGLDSACL